MNRTTATGTKVSGDRPSAGAAAQIPQPASFEEGLTLLADLVGRLEGGQLGLAESIAAYEQGVTLVRTLHGELVDVEQRVRMLTAAESTVPQPGDEGPPEEEDGPLPQASPSGSGAAPRKPSGGRASRSPGGRPRRLPGMDDAPGDV